jgi:hypothetical protein
VQVTVVLLADDGGVQSALACPLIANGASPSANISACRRRSSFGPATHVLARAPDVSPTLATANTPRTLKATSVRYDSSSDVVLRESSDARVNRRVDKMPNSGAARQMIPERCTTATVIDRIFRHVPRHCKPTGRANARPMTGSAKQSILPRKERMDCFAALAMTVSGRWHGKEKSR